MVVEDSCGGDEDDAEEDGQSAEPAAAGGEGGEGGEGALGVAIEEVGARGRVEGGMSCGLGWCCCEAGG